jgi:hypothetical protein
MGPETENMRIDRIVREAGCFALCNLEGTLVKFYPVGRLPRHVAAYLNADEGRRLQLLRNFIVSQARLAPTSYTSPGVGYDPTI